MSNEFVTPVEVFAAIEYAKSLNPADVNGDGAFKIEAKGRDVKGCSFHNFTILKKDPKIGVWGPIQVRLRFVNIKTIARMVSDPTKVKPGQQVFEGARLQFLKSSTAIVNGVEQKYGEAKHAICQAFKRIAKKMNEDGALGSDTAPIRLSMQYNKKGDRTPFPDPFIRVVVDFNYETVGSNKVYKPDITPKIKIYNLDSPKRVNGKVVPNQYNELTTPEGVPCTYGNIVQCLKPGSICSGIDDMSAVTVSNMGISNPSKATILMVKPSKGMSAPEAADVFSAADFAEMGAVVAEIAEDNGNYDDDAKKTAAHKTVSKPVVSLDEFGGGQFDEVTDDDVCE
jgi:hypothetical protein